MNWLSTLIFSLFVGGSLGRSVSQTPQGSDLSKTPPIKYFITGQKDASGHWTEQVKMEHGDEDWHIEVDHVTLEVGDQPKVKITATFSANSKTPGVTTEKPEDSPESIEIVQESEDSSESVENDQMVFHLFPHSHRDWFGAKAVCEEWGGHLAVPDTREKMRRLTEVLRKHMEDIGEPTGAFLGFNDIEREGHFVTVLGKPLFGSQDSTWSPRWFVGQPDDDKSWSNDGEDCGSMRPNGGINDVPCRYNMPFICEKAVAKEETVTSVAAKDENDYTLRLYSHSYTDWFEAKKACIEWGGHLAIPDSEAKMLKMTEILKSRTNNPEQLSAFVGYSDIKEEGKFVTIFDKPVFSSSASWSPDWYSPLQPDDDKSWTTDGEDCGAVHPAGGLNDVPCRYLLPYFCELRPNHDSDSSITSLENVSEKQSNEEQILKEDEITTSTSFEELLEKQNSEKQTLQEDEITTSTSLEELLEKQNSEKQTLQEDEITTNTSVEELLEKQNSEKQTLQEDENTTRTPQEDHSESFSTDVQEIISQTDPLMLFTRNDLDWFKANGACKEWGGHLAVPDSDEKVAVMTSKMNFVNVQMAFLGFGDQEQEGHFVTIFGKPLFNKLWPPNWWRADQPDDDKSVFDDGEDCGSLMAGRGLNDSPCQQGMPFFCEKPSREETNKDEVKFSEELFSDMNVAAQNLPKLGESQIVLQEIGETSSSDESLMQIINAVQNLPPQGSADESSSKEALMQIIDYVQNLTPLDDSQIVLQESEIKAALLQGLIIANEINRTLSLSTSNEPMMNQWYQLE